MKPLVEIRDLLVHRGPRQVLDVPALEVGNGEVLALVGPNGAGKTTLLLVLARLLRPTSGRIRFDQRSIDEWPALEYRRRISFVFQTPLLLDMSVAENVAVGLRFRGWRNEQIRARLRPWLERLGISALAGRRAEELSGGEAQRVSLARAFVLEPQLLLLDEPFSALDAPTRSQLLDDLKQLLAVAHRTVIIVTHDLGDAARLADRVAVIVGGRLRQVGAPGKVKARPADNDVAEFLRQLPR